MYMLLDTVCEISIFSSFASEFGANYFLFTFQSKKPKVVQTEIKKILVSKNS